MAGKPHTVGKRSYFTHSNIINLEDYIMKICTNKNTALYGFACTFGCHVIHLLIPLLVGYALIRGYVILYAILYIIPYFFTLSILVQFLYTIPLLLYFEKKNMWRAHDGVWIGVWTYIGLVYIPAILMFVIDRV